MKKIEFSCGSSISTAIGQLLVASKKEKDHKAQGVFNEVTLIADENSTAESVLSYFRKEQERKAEEYYNSAKGKKAVADSKKRAKEAQQKHDVLVKKLSALNFSDDVAVLDWLCEFQNPSDTTSVFVQHKAVLTAFSEHGYLPNVNTGVDFNENDRDNFARYIIGQALGGLQCSVGAIHQIIHKFTDDWKKKFL